jgi:anti-anti-sigma regulatory factor
VELAYFNVLTPLPGTALYERYNSTGRIFDRDWAKYDGKHVVYYPSRMTPQQLQEGFYWANHQFYSIPSIWQRLSGTKQRLAARIEMNRQFRKMVKRACPQGELSPVASVLKTLQAKLPSFEADQFIPNALHAIKQRIEESSAQDLWLSIRAKRHDKVAALIVDLEGTLDHLNARELLERVRQAAEKARIDIVVNFEHLRQATPAALQTLLDHDTLKAITPHAKIRYRKLRAAFEAAIEGLSAGGSMALEEDWQDA